jgi:hypothetical protein
MKESLNKAQPDLSAFAHKFESSDVDVVGSDLTISDYPVAGELKSGYTEF